MISLICWVLAAICNGIGETSLHHYPVSILPKNGWWDGRTSHLRKYVNGDKEQGRTNVPVWFTDAFHFFKSLMLIFLLISVMTYDSKFYIIFDEILGSFWTAVIIVTFYGGGWIGGFNLMYDKILLLKTWKK